MNIPRFWEQARAEVSGRRGRNYDLVCWRWSDSSVEDAREKAREAVETLAARVNSGEELGGPYGYGLERPLREEIVSTIPEGSREPSAVITRNVYGALVLNAANVMFVDVDFEEGPKDQAPVSGLVSLLTGLFAKKPAAAGPLTSSEQEKALDRIESWVRSNHGWGMRVYRTAAGLRLMAIHDVFEPDSDQAVRVMEALGCDPLYVRLCRAQKSFRARLTPKPWRCGYHIPFVRYPFTDPAAERDFRNWQQKYERACDSHATCELLRTIGSEDMHRDVSRIVQAHDEHCRVGTGLKLA